MKSEEMAALIRVALGDEKADLVITGGSLVNVYTGELLKGYAVAVKGKRIAYVGQDAGHTIGTATKVIDATGKIIVPGFIDSHTHMTPYTVYEFLRYAPRGGTTTIITEMLDISFALGFRGTLEFLESCRDQPIKMFGVVPTMVSLSPRFDTEALSKEQIRELLQREDVLGLGETYWFPVVEQEPRFLELFEEAFKAGKKVTGHSAGARGNKLIAYAAGGVCSCHEPITAAEVLERLRLGMYVPSREGEIRKDLEAIAEIKDMDLDLRQFILATDGTSTKQILEKGYMEVVLEKAIALGFDPITAIQMVTLNPAQYLNLDDRLGGIAPGKFADIVILPDLQNIKAEYVISNGRIIAQNREMLVQPRKHAYPEWARQSIRLAPTFTPEDFMIHVSGTSSTAQVRAIEQIAELVTSELRLEVPVSRGKITANLEQDLIKVAAIDFLDVKGEKFVGLLKGFKLQKGAIASSTAWDLANIVAVGVDEKDLALAVNRIIEMQGGAVVCADGRVLAEFSMPIGGCLSSAPLETLFQKTEEFQRAAAALGSPFQDTHLTLITLTTPAIPFFRLCEKGLVDIRTNEMFGLLVN
ncbi:MAG: adenine deaminase [Firmicutes bacterium]|nr:adenine deaminase [Bacillota bacterium]